MQEIRLLAAVQIFAAMLKDVFGGKIRVLYKSKKCKIIKTRFSLC